MSSRAQYEEVECRTAINRVKGMGFRWSMNPYRGCVHGCHYCFARRFQSYYDLDPGSDFTSVIFVKVNAPQVLGEELSRPSWRREPVSVGTATDPYQPIEGKYRLTRRCLEAFARWRSPITLVTKGTMVVRDIDVLAELSRSADCTVCFSVTTMGPGPGAEAGAGDATARQAHAGHGAPGAGGHQSRDRTRSDYSGDHRLSNEPRGCGQVRCLSRSEVPLGEYAVPQARDQGALHGVRQPGVH